MRKNFKKIVAGAFVGLFALQTVMAMPASAQTTVLGELDFYSTPYENIGVKASKNTVSPDVYSFLSIHDYTLYNLGGMRYNLTYLASTKSQVTGFQNWNFKVYVYDDGDEDLSSVRLYDNKGNTITSSNLNIYITQGSNRTFTISTNIADYDLNYDGHVTLEDAQLANSFSLAIGESPSDLQIMLADTNGNGYIDQTDANYILRKALNMV